MKRSMVHEPTTHRTKRIIIDDSHYVIISKPLREGSIVTNRFFRSSVLNLCGLLSLVILLFASPVHAEERPENIDLKTLLAQAAQFQQRLDQNPADYEALQGLGIVYHSMALKDSKTYAKKAVQYLEQANQKKCDDTVVLCYLGNAYTLLARDASDKSRKMSTVSKGIGFMDKAVRMTPDNITVRLIRANNSKNLPRFLNRRSIAYEDFEHLVDLLKNKPDTPASLKAYVYGNLAALYKEDGDSAKARKYEAMAAAISKEN